MSNSTINGPQPAITGAELVSRAEALIGLVRQHAAEGEELRRIPQPVIEAMSEAGIFKTLVPRRFGGYGLGIVELCEIARTIAHGDVSTAWTIAFLMEHNWMLCRMPMALQEELYADRSEVFAAAPLVAAGRAERVEGGFLVSGTWRYATAIDNADLTFVTSPVDEDGEKINYSFVLAKGDVTVNDDWRTSGMCATSSSTITGESVFVPESHSIETELFHSRDGHPGVAHEEPVFRYPLHPGLGLMMVAIIVGGAEAVTELGRERLSTNRPFGLERLQRAPARIRWSAEAERVRAGALLHEHALRTTMDKCAAGAEFEIGDPDMGQLQISYTVAAHLCHDAASRICEGVGSSAYQLSEPIQRYKRDLDVLINHAGLDWDVVAERSSRWALGLGRGPHDPHPPRRTPRVPTGA